MTTQTGCQRCGRPVNAGAQFCSHCGSNVSAQQGSLATRMVKTGMSAQMQDVLLERLRQATLGEYEVLTELGRGGMATVYLAHDLQLDRKIAIKVMLPELLSGDGMIDRFKLEARTAAQLSHPHIIPIYAVKDVDDLLFFVMKFIEGRPLDTIVKELGQLPIPMVQSIVSKVGEALGYAHRRGVVHRDIKPANLMIDTEGMPIVTDFGIAKVADTRGLTMTGATIGTPTYMSPEQCSAGAITGASDQYSLGVVAYEMLSGELPFQGDSVVSLLYKHCHEPPPPFQSKRPDCPPALHDAVMKMLGKEPEDRFPSLEAAVQGIGSVSLSFDDPVRTQLMDLAKRGQNLTILQRVSTPRSPTPLQTRAKRTVAKKGTGPGDVTMRTSTAERAQRGGRRTLLLGGIAALVVAGAGVAFWHPWSRTGAPTALGAPAGTTAVASIGLEPSSAGLEVSGSQQLTAAPRDAAGQPVTAPITWTSDNPAVASVSVSGLVTANTPGVARIQASAGTTQSVAQITVAAAAPSAPGTPTSSTGTVATIRLDGLPATLAVGGTAQLRAVALDARRAPIGDHAVSWSANPSSVATVTQAGLLTALAPGSVTLTARSGSVSQTGRVQVLAPRAASIAVSAAPSAALAVGATTRLTATVLGDDGRPFNANVSWQSGDRSVATVSDGLVTAVGAGSTTITATADGRDASTTVRVAAPEAPRPPAPDTRPVPPPVAAPSATETREAITAVIQAYARALESHSVSDARRLYPGMSSAEENQVSQMRSYDSLVVRFPVSNLDVPGDNATANVNGEYQFYSRENRRMMNLPVRIQIQLESVGGSWRIRSIRDRR